MSYENNKVSCFVVFRYYSSLYLKNTFSLDYLILPAEMGEKNPLTHLIVMKSLTKAIKPFFKYKDKLEEMIYSYIEITLIKHSKRTMTLLS